MRFLAGLVIHWQQYILDRRHNMKRLFALLLFFPMCIANAAPQAELWPRWQQHDAASETSVSHDAWSQFLSRLLSEKDGIALVNYGAATDSDKQQLAGYVTLLSQTAVSEFNRDEQLAFWINLYNALTVQTVLEHYPVSSIRKISSGFLPTGPWDDKLISVENEELSLNDIEHRILRPIWQDPRLHYAVNCASIGCPNLAMTAYTAATAEDMLNEAAVAYINHPRGILVENGKLHVSSIYEWFAVDFGGTDEAIIAHLRKYAAPELQEQLKGLTSISDDNYDWSLNDVSWGKQ